MAAYNTFYKRSQPWETARVLISKGASDALIDDVTVIKYFYGPRSMLNFLQQHMYPSYREIPPQTRFDIAAQISRSRWHNTPAILSTLLRVEADFDKELLTLTNRWGYTLLHLLVIGFVETNFVWSWPRPTLGRQSIFRRIRVYDDHQNTHPFMETSHPQSDSCWCGLECIGCLGQDSALHFNP